MIDYKEIIIRLSVAIVIGCVLGLDRNIHGKPTGLKTLGLVALGAALVTLASMGFMTAGDHDLNPLSRSIQGVITGIGFLGAGVIVHSHPHDHIRGLTTAASIWVTAAIGIVCGLGAWLVALIGLAFVLVLFLVGGPLERYLHQRWLQGREEGERTVPEKHEP